MSQEMLTIVFILVAASAGIFIFIQNRRWTSRLNKSEEDEALERRMASLNENQANRRRDDEIVRLLRGDEQRTIGQRRDVDD